jgi:hypothetical protein
MLAPLAQLYPLVETQAFVLGLIFHLYWVFCLPVQMMTFVPVGA